MRILIIGATGFIGRELVKELISGGHQPVAVSRNAVKAGEILGSQVETLIWSGQSAADLANILPGFEAVINLAGENLASGRWTDNRKRLITESRLKTGNLVAEAIKLSSARPSVLIQGSAIGIYGTTVDSVADETCNFGTGFIANLTRDWEASVKPAEKLLRRVIWIRTGLVLGKNGGLLKKMTLPFKYYSGTIIGTGRQWMSWIHLIDQVRAIVFLLENKHSAGPYNLTAPGPVMMKDFIKKISEITGKPAWLRVPGWTIKTVLGDMADETILASQNIYPARLLEEGFRFEFAKIEPALRNLLNK